MWYHRCRKETPHRNGKVTLGFGIINYIVLTNIHIAWVIKLIINRNTLMGLWERKNYIKIHSSFIPFLLHIFLSWSLFTLADRIRTFHTNVT